MLRFVACATGLVASGCGATISKPNQSALRPEMDRSGVILASRAFSAVAGICDTAREVEARRSLPLDERGTSSEPDSCADTATGRARFRICVPDVNGVVMVGAAIADTPLDTPLSWEEDHAYMLECKNIGAFLWSERAAVYGGAVLRKDSEFPCCLDRAKGSGNELVADVEVSWNETSVSFDVFPGDSQVPAARRTLERPLRCSIQGRESNVEVQPPLRPFVTLISSDSSVTLLDAT